MNEKYLKLFHESKLEITFFEFVLLVLINEQEHDVLTKILNDTPNDLEVMIFGLETKGYIKWHGTTANDFTLRSKADDLFKKLKKVDKSDVNHWIDEWRELFPEGVNAGGYRYRGSRLEVLKKMTKFVTLYKYSKEEIFEATKRYIERFSIKGYTYMQQAHYFIEKKDSGSTLASECESLKETKSTQTKLTYGGTVY